MRPTLRLLDKAFKTTPRYAVDGHCIPLTPPYSLAARLPPPTPLSRATLLKLHKLAALTPPQSEADWDRLRDLDGLAGVMEGVKGVDTSALGEGMVDGRSRPEAEPPLEGQEGMSVEGINVEDVIKLAERRDGRYYVVPTPVGIRGKRRASQAKQPTQGDE